MISNDEETSLNLFRCNSGVLIRLDDGTGELAGAPLPRTDLLPVPVTLTSSRIPCPLGRLAREGRVSGQVFDKLDGPWITPMQVMEDQDEGPILRQFSEDSRQSLVKLDPPASSRQRLLVDDTFDLLLQLGKDPHQHMGVAPPQPSRLAMFDDEILDQT